MAFPTQSPSPHGVSSSTTSPWQRYNQQIRELLIAQEGLDPDRLYQAQTEADNQPLEVLLVRQNEITLAALGQHLANAYNVTYTPLADALKASNIDELFTLLPADFCQQKQVLPLRVENGQLLVATLQPDTPGLADEITYLSGYRPKISVTCGMELQDFWAARQRQHTHLVVKAQQSEQTFTSLVNDILTHACQQDASDVHIEPRDNQTIIRFRLDGVLVTHQVLAEDQLAGLVARLKVMANMDIAEHRRPQDGQFQTKLTTKGGEQTLFCRVSSFPLSQHREKLSLRLLRPFQGLINCQHLGMTDHDISVIHQLLNQPHGIVLTCGPTGSGKSTSIYAMLGELNSTAKNITTIEDPIELELDGINQTTLNANANRTIETCLKAVLRQDPDVVMIGEIRDEPTLKLTIQAALTGHLMLSTFHANSAASAVTRMVDMGLSPQLLSSSLAGIIAQRLVRQLCPHCKQPQEATPHEKRKLFPYNPQRQLEELVIYHPVGCDFCYHTGYKGRTGVFEIMMIDRELRYLISDRANELQLEDAAIATGMTSLSVNGRLKVLDGITTLDEIMRVIGEW